MRRFLPSLLASFAIIFTASLILSQSSVVLKTVAAANATHVVISEVQNDGGTNNDDEFIELYNPTETTVDMTGWRLTRKTSGGTQNTLVSSISGTIAPRGYFLIAHPEYDGSVSADLQYSATSSAIANNNTILLYSDAGTTLVDKVGMGSGSSLDFEGAPIANPAQGGSVERKSCASSNATTMTTTDQNNGNAEDTDNNANDFVVRVAADPQNKASNTETPGCAAATASPSPTASPTATATASASPTATASPTSTPSPTPSGTPTVTATPTMTATPTATPSPTASPTVTPSLTPSPTATPTETPEPTFEPPFFPRFLGCHIRYHQFRIRFFTLYLPIIICGR